MIQGSTANSHYCPEYAQDYVDPDTQQPASQHARCGNPQSLGDHDHDMRQKLLKEIGVYDVCWECLQCYDPGKGTDNRTVKELARDRENKRNGKGGGPGRYLEGGGGASAGTASSSISNTKLQQQAEVEEDGKQRKRVLGKATATRKKHGGPQEASSSRKEGQIQ